jgi:uncharacterized repeat protein (TIGR02543 family)
MKKKIIITIIILLVTAILGVGGYFIYAINQGPAEIEDTDAEFESTLLEAPKDGSDPSKYSVEENVSFALWTVANTNEFYTLTTGTAQASVANQQIYNKRVVKDKKAMTTMISSGLVSTAKQKYFLPDKVLLRDATSINGETATWITSAPEEVSYKTIQKRNGWLPYQATGYIICSDTYINKEEMKMVDNQDGTFTLLFDLDPDGNKAPFWYRREVLTNANSSIVPEFYSIHFEMTINSSWQILVDDIQEQYKVKSMGVEAVTKKNCHEEFYYENVEFDKEPYDYFESYAYLSVLEDEKEDLPTSEDAMSIIVESLQNKDKSDTVLDLSISTDGFKTQGLVSLNITDLTNIKVYALLEDLYVEYTDSLYLSIGGIKVKANMDDLTTLIETITSVLPSSDTGSSLDVSKIMDDLAKSKMEDDGVNVSIDTKLDLMGILLPIHFDIIHEDDTYKLVFASADIDLNGEIIHLGIKSTNKKINPLDHKDFMDLKNLVFIVSDIVSIIEKKNLDLSLELEYRGLNIKLDGNLSFETEIKLDSKINLTYGKDTLSLDLYYLDDTIYLGFNNIKLKITTNDLLRLIEKYSGKTIDLNMSLDFNLRTILETVFSIDYDKLLEELVITDNSLDLALSLEEITDLIHSIKLSILDTNYGISGSIAIDDIHASFKVGNLSYKTRTINKEDYYNLAYLEGFIDDAICLYKDGKLGFDLSMDYKDLHIAGSGILDYSTNIQLSVNLEVNYKELNVELSASYIEDILYLDILNTKLMISKDDLIKIVSKFTDLNTNSLDLSLDGILTILFKMDYEKLIKELVIEENSIDIALDISSFVDGMNSISLSIKKDNGINVLALIKEATIHLNIHSTKNSVSVTGDYQNLGYIDTIIDDILAIYNSKKLNVALSLSYKGLDIEATGIIDFNDSIRASVNLEVAYQNKAISLDIYYIDDCIYLDFDDCHILLSKADLEKIIALFSDNNESESIFDNLLSIDFEEVLKAISITEDNIRLDMNLSSIISFLSDISITLKDISSSIGLDISIKDLFDVNIIASSSNSDILLPAFDYQDLGKLYSLFEMIKGIIDNKGISLNVSLEYEDIKINGNGNLLFKNNLSAEFNLNVSYKTLEEDIQVQYFDSFNDMNKVLFIDLGNNHLMLPLSILLEDTSSMKVEDIIDIIFSVDFTKVLVSLMIEENKLDLTLDLSDFDSLENIIDIHKDIYLELSILDGVLSIASSEVLNIQASISLFDGDITPSDNTFVDLSNLVSNIKEFISWIKEDSFKVSIDGNIQIKSISIDLNGSIDFILENDKYNLNGNFHIEAFHTLHDVYFKLVDNVLYLEYGDATFGIDLSNMNEFIEEVFSIFGHTSPDFDFKELDSIIDSLEISEDSISIDLSTLVDFITKITIALSYSKNDEMFNIHISSDEINLNTSIAKITNYAVSLPTEYLDNEDILSLCRTIKRVIDLLDKRDFNLNLDLDVMDNGYKHLNINGNLMIHLGTEELKDFKIDDLSFKASIAITEYEENGKIKVVHRVDLTLVSDMVYIVYGNNESNLSSKIKFYAEKDSIFSVLASITSVLGLDLDFLNDYMNQVLSFVDISQLKDLFNFESKVFDVSSLIKKLDITEDGLEVSILVSVLNDIIPSSKLVTVKLEAKDDIPLSLELLGLYTDYVSENEYTRIDLNYLTLTNDSISINAPSDLSSYYNIFNIDELVNGILTTASNKDYAISGTVTLGLPIVSDIDVNIDAKVRVLEDGSPLVYLHLDMSSLPLLAKTIGLKEKDVYFYYMDGYVYIYRKESSTTYKLKVSYQEFFDDIMYYLMDFSLGMPDIILNAINSSTNENEDYVIDAGTVINSYSYNNHKFNFSLDMEALTDNSNLGDMSLSLVLKNMAISKNSDGTINTSYALTEIANFEFKLVSVITLGSSSIALTNTYNEDGYTWFKSINMDDVVSFIEGYSYGTDMIYKNDTYIGKRSHTITFVLNYLDNEYYQAQTGATIKYPNLDIVEVDGKYYLFDGWYSDKYLKEEFTSTTMPESNIKVYAAWKEIHYYDLTIHSMDGNTVESVYGGASLSTYLDKEVYTDSLGDSYILKGYSYTLDGDIVYISSMPNDNLVLFAKWEKVSYKVYLDDTYYMDLAYDKNLALTKDYYLSIDNAYFEFDKDYLNYETLVVKYNKYLTITDGIGYIYLYSDASSLGDYYIVELDYDIEKFNDKLYKAVALDKNMDFDSKYLPSGVYNHMNINYWYNNQEEYHLGNIHLLPHQNTTLKAYYATCDYLSYGYDMATGESLLSVTGFNYSGSDLITIILPKYVKVDGSYEILRSLALFVDDDNNKYTVFTYNNKIYAIYFNDGFEVIGDNAFKDAIQLTNVYFSNTITSVASDAFYMTVGSNAEANAAYAEKIRF